MKIRIVKQPVGVVEGAALHHYRLGHVYDVPSTLANYLVAEGFAILELRDEDSRTGHVPDRRKKPGQGR